MSFIFPISVPHFKGEGTCNRFLKDSWSTLDVVLLGTLSERETRTSRTF